MTNVPLPSKKTASQSFFLSFRYFLLFDAYEAASALAVNHDPFFSETSDPRQIGDTRFVDRPYSTVAFLS